MFANPKKNEPLTVSYPTARCFGLPIPHALYEKPNKPKKNKL